MEDNSKDIDIKNEQKRIKDKIDTIKDSGVFKKIRSILNNFKKDLRTSGIKNIELAGRVKKEDSASEKIARQGVSADEIYDLIGFMLVVDLPEEYENARQIMKESMPKGSFVHDFDGALPENNGYSSFHMGINVKKLLNENGIENPEGLENLSTEVQLKTYGMYMAQEATHDSIYKNGELNTEQKNKMQSVMFPLIEKITDIEKYQERLEICFDENEKSSLQGKIDLLKQQVLQQKMQNSDYIEENMPNIENVLKQYVVVKYIEKVKHDPTLGLSREKIVELAEQCNNAIEYLSKDNERERLSKTEPTGFKNTDELLEQTQSKSIIEIQTLSAKSQEKQIPSLLQGAIQVSEEQVTSADVKNMVATVNEKAKAPKQQVHISSQEQENGER